MIRGLSPYPGAFFIHDEKTYKVFSSEISNKPNLKPGEIDQSKNEIFIGTSNAALRILEIQPEGRKRMNVEDFLRGYSLI